MTDILLELKDFDNFNSYSLNKSNMKINRQPNDWQPDGWPEPGTAERSEMKERGWLKNFTFGSKLAIYSLTGKQGPHYILFKGKIFKFDKSKPFWKKYRFFCLSVGTLKLDQKINIFIDVSWRQLFSTILFPPWLVKRIDPTWDEIDEMCSKPDDFFDDILSSYLVETKTVEE